MGLFSTFWKNPWRDERVCREFSTAFSAHSEQEGPPCRPDHHKLLSSGTGAALRALDLIQRRKELYPENGIFGRFIRQRLQTQIAVPPIQA